MDSDEMQGRSRDTHSVASTQDSFMAKSIQSSTNSRTGLLDSARNTSKMNTRPIHNEDDGAPVRTRRRVKDPYAIPDSDEDEEEEEEMLHTPKAHREESLMDFLNSVPPPQANASPPPLDIPKSAVKSLQRKTSGPSMRSRFASGSHEPPEASKDLPLDPNRSGTTRGTLVKTAYDSTPPRDEASKHAGNTRSGYVPRSQTVRQQYGHGSESRANGIRPPRKQMSARTDRDDTSLGDLADFLMNSAPPEMPPTMPASPPTKEKEEGGFSRMFSRKKSKNAAVM